VEARLLASQYFPDGQWGGLESSLLKFPTVMAVAKPGTYAIADASEAKIKMIDDSGALLWSADPGAMAELGLLWVGGLIVDRAGNIVVGDPENHGLIKWNPEGKLLGRWGSFGAAAEEFNTPLGLAGDEDGRIYVADSGNHRVKILSPEGTLIKILGDPEVDPGRFNTPRAVAVFGPTIYILDAARIQTYSREGVFQSAWTPQGPNGEPVENPLGLAVDEAGCVYLTESKSSRVFKFDSEGVPVCVWGKAGMESGELGEPWGILADGMGRIFVVERANHRIQIFTVGPQKND
jgi:DNA-binding beta-propeller fold protein YncE